MLPDLAEFITESLTSVQIFLRNKNMKKLANLRNNSKSLRISTNGSAKDAIRNGGSGVDIKHPTTTSSSHSFAVGKLASNFRAELKAIERQPKFSQKVTQQTVYTIIISDCRAALQPLQSEARDEIVEIINYKLI